MISFVKQPQPASEALRKRSRRAVLSHLVVAVAGRLHHHQPAVKRAQAERNPQLGPHLAHLRGRPRACVTVTLPPEPHANHAGEQTAMVAAGGELSLLSLSLSHVP